MRERNPRSRTTAVVEATETGAALRSGWLPALAAEGGVRVLLPGGEVAGEGYELIERACRPPLRIGGPRLVLDLSRVTHLEYRGLPALVRAARALRAEGGDLRLAGGSQYVKTILRFGGIEGELRAFPTTAAAVASFAPREAAELRR